MYFVKQKAINSDNTIPWSHTALTILIGAGSDEFDGKIDQVRFYSRPLEDYEIVNLYNGGAGY